MKRPYLLRVDCLEDRCVPAANILDSVYETPTLPPDESFVIDVFPIDPNGVDAIDKPIEIDDTVPIPGLFGDDLPSESTLPPVGDPFQFPTSLVDESVPPDESFVIDVFPVDPNGIDIIDKPLEIDDTVPIEPPSESTLPPVGDPFQFPTSFVDESVPPDESFVIDVFPIDPNGVDAIDKPIEIDDTVPIDDLPSDATIPPIDGPIAA